MIILHELRQSYAINREFPFFYENYNINYCMCRVTIGLSQSLFKAYEGEPTVQVCAELLKGQLGTNLSLIIQADKRGTDHQQGLAIATLIILVPASIKNFKNCACAPR